MKHATKIIAGVITISAIVVSGVGIVSATAPALPTEQQALVNAGYTKTLSWAKFDKQDGGCHITVEASGKNYYILTKGKRKASLYPVIASQVVNGAAFMDENCQG